MFEENREVNKNTIYKFPILNICEYLNTRTRTTPTQILPLPHTELASAGSFILEDVLDEFANTYIRGVQCTGFSGLVWLYEL